MQINHEQAALNVISRVKPQLEQLIPVENGWKVESEKNGLKFCTRKSEDNSGLVMTRSEMVFNKNIKVIADHLNVIENKLKDDDTCVEAKTIESFSNNLKINYIQTKGQMGVDGRDICSASQLIDNGDSMILVRGNYDHPSAITPKGIVRADIIISGYLLTKINENSTNVILVSCADPKGSIPGFLKSKAAQKDGERLRGMKESIEKL